MNAHENPALLDRERERSARNGIIRSAIIWTPFFLITGGALLFFFFDEVTGGDRGSWFLIIVLTIFAVLFGSQSIQAIADLLSKPRTMEGPVTRRWTRNDSLVLRTHYVRVGKTILRGDRLALEEIKTGDRVAVRFFAHSGVLIAIEKLAEPPKPETPELPVADAEEAEATAEEPVAPRKQADRSFWE
jgi:hypothetical protein